MIKPKKALVDDGFLPKGSENKKGRLSAPAIARLHELAAKGIQIEGYSSSTDKSTGAVTVSKEKVNSTGILDVPDEAKSESLWTAFVEGKEIGMREVCNVCSNSFTYCHCAKPLFWVDYDREAVVVFKPKSAQSKG